MLATLLSKQRLLKLASSLQVHTICNSSFVHCKGSIYSCVQLQQKNIQGVKFLSTSKHLGDNAFLRVKNRVYEAITGSSGIQYSACIAYEHCVDSVNYNEFVNYFEIPDTFHSWFLIAQLHVWMCITVMISEKQGRVFRNSIVENMWNDIEIRLDKLVTMRRSDKKKNLATMVDQFQAALISYDEGILGNDMDLAAAAWRTFFNFKEVDPRLLETMVIYIRKQLSHLDSIRVDDIRKRGSVSFLPLKSAISHDKTL